ncbi:MAG: ATP-binding cassette, subfamily bacterial [Kribbellaceae bacterium]|nr:ATP-binding cassette, subfamily bacterial [Kribbellaceae bacterium]
MIPGSMATRLPALLPSLAALVTVGVIGGLVRAGSTAASGRLAPHVDRLASTRLLRASLAVELAEIEAAEFQSQLTLARRGAPAARQLTEQAIAFLKGATGLLAASGTLAVLHPLLLPLLMATVVPTTVGAVRCARARFASMKNRLELTRQIDMLSSLMLGEPAAEEIRIHQAADFLLAEYERLASRAEREQAELAHAQARTTLVADTLSGAALVATYSALALFVVTGVVPFAVAGAAVFALRAGTSRLGAMVASINQMYESGLLVGEWETACVKAEAMAAWSGDLPLAAAPEEITARGVTFTYPGAPRAALDGVDVAIRRGEIVALVGENGSGKTTLAKILTGLYFPDAGTVSWNGRPIQLLDRQSLFGQIALVSQSFMRWPFSARSNIRIGRSEVAAEGPRFGQAVHASGADEVVAGLAHGWDSLLAHQFLGGTQLSGGQWQRMGVGRAWFRDAAVVVFDEPTAALDPRSEVEVFDQVSELADDGRLVLLVTHRLASVRRADRVYVLDAGKVIESGNHEQLMTAGGRYSELYRLQADQFSVHKEAN